MRHLPGVCSAGGQLNAAAIFITWIAMKAEINIY
jgi:hypothetical protein